MPGLSYAAARGWPGGARWRWGARSAPARPPRPCGRGAWPRRSAAGRPSRPASPALPVVGDGWARLHLRRDGRGHRRVPPSVGEDRVGLSAAQLGIIGSATPFGFLFGAVIAGILGDRIGRRSVMLYASDLLLRLHARRRGRTELPGVRRRPRARRIGHGSRERDHRPVPRRVRAPCPARLVPRCPGRLLLLRVRRRGPDRPVRGPAVRRGLAMGPGRHGRTGTHGPVVAPVAAGVAPLPVAPRADGGGGGAGRRRLRAARGSVPGHRAATRPAIGGGPSLSGRGPSPPPQLGPHGPAPGSRPC